MNSTNYWHVATVHAPPWTGGTYRGWSPCMDWCRNTFGGSQTTNLNVGHGWRYLTEGVFEFEHEADRTAFLLRWS